MHWCRARAGPGEAQNGGSGPGRGGPRRRFGGRGMGRTAGGRRGGALSTGPSRGEQNDYCQRFVDTGERPQIFLRDVHLVSSPCLILNFRVLLRFL